MNKPRAKSTEIRNYILDEVSDHPRNITNVTAEKFGISRQAVLRHMRKLLDEGFINVEGKTRDRQYSLKPLAEHSLELPLTPTLEEDAVWRQHIQPLLEGVSSNVLRICEYGFSEMLNNVIDHSEGSKVLIKLKYTPTMIEMMLQDDGVGIFQKIQQELGLEDQQRARLELSKGKLTTDPQRHTGEGIFFTSHMFDRFANQTSQLSLFYTQSGSSWSHDTPQGIKGTRVSMQIDPDSERNMQDVFDEYSPEEGDYQFTRTHIPVVLAKYGDENLLSRSQAKRVLSRLDRFNEALFDFRDVESIGQAFADEIFRVFQNANPHMRLTWTNVNKQVEKMILRAIKR